MAQKMAANFRSIHTPHRINTTPASPPSLAAASSSPGSPLTRTAVATASTPSATTPMAQKTAAEFLRSIHTPHRINTTPASPPSRAVTSSSPGSPLTRTAVAGASTPSATTPMAQKTAANFRSIHTPHRINPTPASPPSVHLSRILQHWASPTWLIRLPFRINVTPLNDPPSLTNTTTPLASADAGQSVSFSAADLLAGYSDIDGDSLSITAVSLINTDAGSSPVTPPTVGPSHPLPTSSAPLISLSPSQTAPSPSTTTPPSPAALAPAAAVQTTTTP